MFDLIPGFGFARGWVVVPMEEEEALWEIRRIVLVNISRWDASTWF